MAWTISDQFPPWGDTGERPSDNKNYAGGDQVNEKHFDYLWYSCGVIENDVRAALTDIDSDKDGIVDEADTLTAGGNLKGDLTAVGGEIIWDESAGYIPAPRVQQGPGSGLDADTVDGQQAADGTGPTITDAGGTTAHVVTELRFGAEGSSTTSTSYTTIAASDIARDFANMQDTSGTVYIRMVAHLFHNGAGTTYLRIYRQNAGTAVTGTEVTKSADGWGTVTTGWVDVSAESGFESYQLQMKTSDGAEGRYNSVFIQLGVPA